MAQKYELLSLPTLISYEHELHSLSIYILKFTSNMDLLPYYNTCELVLFLYNCIINSNIIYNDENVVSCIVKLHNNIFKDKQLTEIHEKQINIYLDYIKQYKLCTKITNVYYYSYLLYNFFFSPNIYITQQ